MTRITGFARPRGTLEAIVCRRQGCVGTGNILF
jgi:hypothetical protein